MPNAADGLRIGGLTRCSSVDLPGRLAAVVFLQGCPWRCGYCHNPELLDANSETQLTWEAVRGFLARRRGLLDAVVFSGGEPTLQPALGAALDEVRAMGFHTALHTSGAYPERLAEVLHRLDWVGLDIKAPWHRLSSVTGAAGSTARVKASLARLMASGVPYECRTTWHAGLFPTEDLHAMGEDLAAVGVRDWAVQLARGRHAPASLAEQDRAALAARFERFTLRAA